MILTEEHFYWMNFIWGAMDYLSALAGFIAYPICLKLYRKVRK